jgi:hypothetical protein
MEPFTKEGILYREKMDYLNNTENPDPAVVANLEKVKDP